MTASKRVLVTGSAGKLGQAASRALRQRGHFVRGFDVRPTPDADEHRIASIADGASIYEAVRGVDCVVHLAATPDDENFPRRPPPDDSDNFLSQLLPNNVVEVYHLLEAIRKAGVPKLIAASSGQVVWDQSCDGPYPIDGKGALTPRYWYAATKAMLESIGYSYAKCHGLDMLAVRLGWCPRPGQEKEIAASERAQDVYLSPDDAGRFFVSAVEAKFSGFHIVYATSVPMRMCRLDLSVAKSLLGFEPADVWPAGIDPAALA